MTEYDEKVKENWKTSYGNYLVKLVDVAGLEDEFKKMTSMPLHLRAFVSSNSKRMMSFLIQVTNGLYTNDLY